jgi:beta-N-acetylhexosaminidase
MNPLAVVMPGFVGVDLPDWVALRLQQGMAGVCLFAENVESVDQLRALTDAIYAANPHAIISMDEEGGDVTRLFQHRGSPFPGNAILGRLADAQLSTSVGEQVGWELRDVGVGLALAPDVDVNSDPHNPVIGVRSFGADPYAVAAQAAAWTRGIQSTGVAACAKHFPGHGDTNQDSHLALPVIEASIEQLHARELAPFRAAIASGIRTIMTSHLLVPAVDAAYPATLSRAILEGLLRGDLGFEGVIVSDALDMAGASANRGIPQAAALALGAGCDLLCIGTDNSDAQVMAIAEAITQAAGGPKLPTQRINAAIARTSELGAALAVARASRPVPKEFTSGSTPGLTPERVASAFYVSGTASALLDRPREELPLAWLRLDPAANFAVGLSPWGPFTEGGIVPLASIRQGDDPSALRDAVPAGALPVVVGKDNHRHPWARAAIDALRADGDVVVIDMGWPDPTYAYADIATFGASKLAGDALLGLIG